MSPTNGRTSSSEASYTGAKIFGENLSGSDRRAHPSRRFANSSSSSSVTTVSHFSVETTAPEQQHQVKPPDSANSFPPPGSQQEKTNWSPSPLTRQLVLEDESQDYPQRFSHDTGSEQYAGIPIPQNFMRSFSPSNDSIHTSSSFTRSAAPIALFADDTDYSDSDAEAGPSSSNLQHMQSSGFSVQPPHALGLGFDDTDLDLSFDDSPVAARNVRREAILQAGSGSPRSPSLRHVGRLPRRELGGESGSERDSIIGLSSPETSPPPLSKHSQTQALQSPASHWQQQQLADVNEAFYTPRVGGHTALAAEPPSSLLLGSLAERTPSADQRRNPRSISATAGSARAVVQPMPPLPMLKSKTSLSTGSVPFTEPFSTFRSPSSRPSLLLASTRSTSSPRSPDSAPTEVATPTIEDYDAGESGFSSMTGRQSSMFGSSSMLGVRNTSFTGASFTNSPEMRAARDPTALVPVYSDMESESDGLGGLTGLRQASAVSERWDEDFLFQEETGDDEPRNRTRARRKGRKKETQEAKSRTASAPTGGNTQKAREMRQQMSRGEGLSAQSAARSATQGKAAAGSSSRPSRLSPEQSLARRNAENDSDSDGSDGSFSGDEEEGADETMQEQGRDIFDDDDEEEENWDGEMSMLSGSSVNMSTVGGKMTASSSARTIMPATPSNLLMTGMNPRAPSNLGSQTPTGLGSRRVTPKANKKSSAALLQPVPSSGPSSFESVRRAHDARSLKSLKGGEDDGPVSGSSSHDHDGNGKAGLRSSIHSQAASVSSRSAGTAAHVRMSMISNSTDGLGSSAGGPLGSLHKKGTSISASTDFSARLAAQSEVSSWHGHGSRSRPSLDRSNSRGEVDFASVEVREDPVARQPITALVAETSAQTRERARAWVEENSREIAAESLNSPARKASGKRKQSKLFQAQQAVGSAAEDTETEDTSSALRPRTSQKLLHSSPSLMHLQGAEDAGPSRPVVGRSPTQSSLSNLLSFSSKKREGDSGSSPQTTSSPSRRIRTTSRVQKLVTADDESRPPSRAASTSSRSPETQRDRIKKLLVQQHKQKKGKASKLGSPTVEISPPSLGGSDPAIPERKRTRSQNSRSKLALSQSPSVADINKPALLAPGTQSPGRSTSPFGRSWDALRSATTTGLQKLALEGGAEKGDVPLGGSGDRDEGLPSQSSSGALDVVKSSDSKSAPAPPAVPAKERPRHGRTGSSLSISFGIPKPFSGAKGKGATSAQRQELSHGRKPSSGTANDGGISSPPERGVASKTESSHEESPASSPTARRFSRKNNMAPPPQPSLPSALAGPRGSSLRGLDSRSTSNSTAVTNNSSLGSSDFWSRQGDALTNPETYASQSSRRVPSGNSSNTTTPTLGSPESPRTQLGTAADLVQSLPQSRRTSASKASHVSGRRSRRPSTSPELPYAEIFGEPPSNNRSKAQIPEAKERQASGHSQHSRNGTSSRPSGMSALKSSPNEPVPPVTASQIVTTTDESTSSKFVPRRNSLSDLKIPTRISRAQDGIRANMSYLKDFARGIGELKQLQGRYHAALLELHRHQEVDGFVDSRSKELLFKLDNVEHLYAPWWECADVLIGLGEGRGEADRSATLETLTHSPAPAPNRNRRITLNTPPRSIHSSFVPMSKDLSSDATSAMVSDTSSSNMSVRRADTSSAVSRASSMSGRQVAAQREMDILSLMLAGAPLDYSFANSSREGGAKASNTSTQSRSTLEDVFPGSENGRDSAWSQSTSSLTFAQPSPRPPRDEQAAPRSGPYKALGTAAQSTASIAATSTDSFANLNTLDPDKSGRRKLRNASRAGLQGLRELLRSFKLSTNAEAESAGSLAADSSVSTPAEEPGPPPSAGADGSASFLDAMYGRPQQSKSSLMTREGLGRPHSAQGTQPSPSRRRSKIFSLVTAGLSSSRLDVIPSRQRVISTASSSAHSSSHFDAADNSADSGWAHSENDEMDAMRASMDSIRVSQLASPPTQGGKSGVPGSAGGGTRQRLLTLGRQLMGSRPRGDSFTSRHGVSPTTLNIPLPSVEDEGMSGEAGESGFSNASSYVSDRSSSRAEYTMGPPDSADQMTLGRRQGERLQMGVGMSGTETIRRPSALSGSAGDGRRSSAGLRPTDSNRTSMLNRPPAYGRSFSASPSPGPSPSHSLQQIPAVPPLPSPMILEGLNARARDAGSHATTATASSLGGESWGSLGSDSDAGMGTTTTATTVPGQRGLDRGPTPTLTTSQDTNGSSSTSRPTTVSDAAAMSRFRKLILRPDAIRSLLAYVQATKNHCDTALVEVSRLAEAMEAEMEEMMAASPPSQRGGGRDVGGRKMTAQTPEEEEEEKEVLGTIRSPSAMTPKRRMVNKTSAM
ncbi:hypothetical protein CF319_g399 [Tilletia indica]|nr:hypothetical protein CF319_g399 [Tilletia indica]